GGFEHRVLRIETAQVLAAVARGRDDPTGRDAAILLCFDDEPVAITCDLDRFYEVRNDRTARPLGVVGQQTTERLDIDAGGKAGVVLQVCTAADRGPTA